MSLRNQERERSYVDFEPWCEIEPQEPGRPRMRGGLDNVLLAPLLAEEMANDRDRQREHQAARLSPDFLWE